MDILYRQGRATAGEVMEALSGTPSYSTVRTQLRVLEEKGHVRHEEQGLKYVYIPAVPRTTARRSALRHLVETFFDGSAERAVAALLGGEGARLSDEELERIGELVKEAGKPGRAKTAKTEGKS
jgi:predicted transcriptional regulator